MRARTIAFWLLFAVTMALYAVMVLWSLPVIAKAAAGLMPFDLRPGGYGFDQAQAFLTALPDDGKAFYLNVQQRFDLFYPALLAATLFFAIGLLAPARWGAWRWVLALTALPGAVFDYLENHAVAGMLQAGAGGVTPEIVAAASRWTVLKSQSTAIAMVILLALLLMWAGNKLRARARRA